MAEQSFNDGATGSDGTSTTSDTTVELNIKTLDSRIFTFRVEKTIPVLSFKEKIAGDIGVPVGQQRLIFRGKVLKDEHLLLDYHVENGDTLHLVERQPTQPHSAPGSNSGATNVNNGGQGNEGVAGPPRNRFGQIAHSVVLGSFNVGDQGDGAVPDVNRVIGAVLNSLGIGNLAGPGSGVASQNAAPGSETGAAPVDAATQMGGQTRPAQHQPSQFPPAGASIPLPTFQTPIPDSLRTISEFINRMEGVFSPNGNQLNQSSPEPADQPAVELPSNPVGFPTPEALSIVLRHTQQLVTGGAATMLSHIAGRLEQDAGSTDPSVRSQIQNESVRLGLVMQHLGALFLELGRTILTLRMGLSPVESGINAGPAVYISSSGPNPIMAQPFPLQTSPLFNITGSSATMGSMGPIGIIGAVPRHVNIHIHAGTLPVPLGPTIGARPRTADGTQTVRNGQSGSGGSGPRASSARDGVPGRVPPHPAGAASPVTVAVQPVSGVSTTLPPDYDPASLVADFNMEIEALVRQRTASASAPLSTTSGLRQGTDATTDRSTNESVASPADSVLPNDSTEAAQAQKDQSDSKQRDTEAPQAGSGELSAVEASRNKEVHGKPEKSTENAPMHSENRDHNSDRPTSVPLGLGLGGLQPKRSKPKPKSDGGATSTANQGQPADVSPGQVPDPNNSTARQTQPGNTQMDLSGMMSQFIQSPALNGIFSGLASQAGGSADDLRNMFHSFTQNPDAMNTVSQLAQQLTRDADLQPMLSGLGGGQGGGLDLSRMFQQMMPVVSRALGGNSDGDEMFPALGCGLEPSNIGGRTRVEDRSFDQSSQDDLQQAVRQIMQISSAQDLFGAVVQHAAHLDLNGDNEELVYDLCDDDGLANEFVEVFNRDLRDRLQGDPRSAGNS